MDLHEFLLNKGLDPLTPLITSSGEEFFLSDLIEEYWRINIISKEKLKYAKPQDTKSILAGLTGLFADEPLSPS